MISNRVRGGVATLTGNASYALSQLVVLLLLASYTSLVDVGRYALGLAITAPIHVGLGFRLRTSRVVNDPLTHALGTYYALALIGGGIGFCLSCLVGAALSPDEATFAIVLALSISKGVESLLEVEYGELQRRELLDRLAASQVARSVLTVLAALIALHFRFGALGIAIAVTIAWTGQLAVLLMLSVRRRDTTPVRPRRGYPAAVGSLLSGSWPLGVAAAITSLNGASPRLVASITLTTSQVGLLALLAYPTTLLALVANSIGQSQLASLKRSFDEGNRGQLLRVTGVLHGIVATLGIVGIAALIALQPALTQMTNGTFGRSELLTAVLLMTAATLGGCATAGYYLVAATGAFSMATLASLGAAAVGVPLMYLMSLHYGLVGLAAAVALTAGFQWVLTLALARRELGPPGE